jgi:hypothetical protein
MYEDAKGNGKVRNSKRQHWRGFRAKSGCKCPPMLEFGFFIKSKYNRETLGVCRRGE